MNATMLNWYLVYLKPRNEDKISERLSDCGFEVFNPKLKERRFVRRKLSDVIAALFPGYIFVRFDYPSDYRLISYTRGVKKVVGTENYPTPVPQAIIDSIRARLVEGVAVVEAHRFAPGEAVVIQGGPFKGLDAIFEKEMKGMERVCVLLREINARVVVDGAALVRP